jgi:hypothetical protein
LKPGFWPPGHRAGNGLKTGHLQRGQLGDTLSRPHCHDTSLAVGAVARILCPSLFFCSACWIISDDRVQKRLVLDEFPETPARWKFNFRFGCFFVSDVSLPSVLTVFCFVLVFIGCRGSSAAAETMDRLQEVLP